MELSVMWSPWNQPGLEHLKLRHDENGVVADSLSINMTEDGPIQVQYFIRCDPSWRIRLLKLELLDRPGKILELESDGTGRWITAAGESLPDLDNCIDLDISITPFTNTLPIRRLQLQPGQKSEVEVVYVKLPELEIRPVRQHYTCLEINEEGGRYRYENISSGFRDELEVDTYGLVLNYPDVFKRIWFEL
jgi:hypothetical protein